MAILRRALPGLDLRVVLPGGSVLGGGGPDAPEMRIHNPSAFVHRLGVGGLIGFGESYQAGEWDADDLGGVMEAFARRVDTLVPTWMQVFRSLYCRRQPRQDDAGIAGARTNAALHYDLSNELFALFLDESMTYSCALFDGDPGFEVAGARSQVAGGLAAAQRRKIDRILDETGVGRGTQMIEIGTGWGELAIRAAARGAQVRTITLSVEQRALAIERITEADQFERVEVDICDYREVQREYDVVISVEMIEAVGYDKIPVFLRCLDRVLAPGGRVGLQAITMRHDRMMAARDTYTWIQKYIFPGGFLPSERLLFEALAKHTTLRVEHAYRFGADYAATLGSWRTRFADRADELARLGFDDNFQRTWNLYLAHAEAGFRTGYLDVGQYVLSRR